jgi:alanine transaminase
MVLLWCGVSLSTIYMLRASFRLMSAYVNPRVVEAQYAVRGLIPTRADELKAQMAKDPRSVNFQQLIYCNIGNPQALDQPPLSFYREVASLIDCPRLLESVQSGKVAASTLGFSAAAIERATDYAKKIGNKTGAYTDSTGYGWVREEVAAFIQKRDARHGCSAPASPGNIILTDGASTGVRLVMTALVAGKEDAVMIPIPQYPLYTAQIALLGGTPSMYYLDESRGWSLNTQDLQKAFNDTKATGATPRLLVVINPGNPTGQLLDRKTMADVVTFCHANNVLLLADEVYQENVYAEGKQFHSFREVVLSMPDAKVAKETMLVSLHSTSKGIIGECGRRGGYFELVNIPSELSSQIIKLCSINLCSNVNGQVMTSLMCTPPQDGTPAAAEFSSEYNAIFASLKRRAELLKTALNQIQGIQCNPVEGAMYAFPSLVLPAGYHRRNDELNAANKTSIPVDARWALELLEQYGVVVVPGSGFGQKPGTLHFRTTILPSEADMKSVVAAIQRHQDRIYALHA